MTVSDNPLFFVNLVRGLPNDLTPHHIGLLTVIAEQAMENLSTLYG